MARKKNEESFDVETFVEEEPAVEIQVEEEPVVVPEVVADEEVAVENTYGPEFADLVINQATIKLWREKAFLRPESVFSQVRFEKSAIYSTKVDSDVFRAVKSVVGGGTIYFPEGFWNPVMGELQPGEKFGEYLAYIKP